MKNKIFSPAFFILTGLFLLVWNSLLLAGCHLIAQTSDQETVLFILPQWPPQDNLSDRYPELSRWKIQMSSASDSLAFYTTEQQLAVSVTKNEPFAITATPVTLLDNGQECAYFYMAGIIYPYGKLENKMELSWSLGFPANQLQIIAESKKETGVSEEHLLNFLMSFNWQKSQENILNKIENSCQSQEEAVFNPWYIDSQKLLENLCYGNFKSTYLNASGCYDFAIETLFPQKEIEFLSPFIPENQMLEEKALVSLPKNKTVLLGDAHKYAAVFTAKSAKNLSREYISMPIYIEEL